MMPQQIADSILQHKDKDYFDIDEEKLADMTWELLRTEFSGLALNGPDTIDLDKKNKLPLLLGIRCSSAREQKVFLEDNCTIILSDLNAGTISIERFFPENEDPVMGAEPIEKSEPDETTDSIFSADVYQADCKERFYDCKWKTGPYAAGIISYDWLSNSSFFSINAKAEEQTETSGSEEKQGTDLSINPNPNPLSGTTKGGFARKKSVEAYPSYEPIKNITLSKYGRCNFKIETTKSNSKVVFASFVLKAKPINILENPEILTLSDSRQRKVIAKAPVSFLLFSLNNPIPLQFDWIVPVYGNKTVKTDELVKGYFAIDFILESKLPIPPNKYMSYIVINGEIYGPQPIEITR